ncbi:MAG: FecR domain-containing protein [Steroidobacteraceae bacterium]
MRHFTDRFAPRAAAVIRLLLAGLLSALLPLQAIASPDADDIVVVTVKGEVKVTSGGGTQDARAGSTLELPASLRTGRDGSSDLRQGETTIGIGPDTRLDFPAPAATAGALERVLQPSGNAFYNVGPQGNRRLRVETPLLVAVIKGTQFNVVVAPDRSTITLFEGRLQVLATEDGIAAVELNAGEIAVRRAGEKTIQVLKLRNGGAEPSAPAGSSGDDGTAGLVPSDPGGQGSGLPDDALPPDDGVDDAFGQDIPGLPTSPTDGGIAIDVDGGTDGLAGLPIGVDAGLGTEINLGAGELGANLNTGVDAGIDLGAGTIDAGIDAGVDLGAASVDAAVDAGVDLGAGTIDAGVDAGVDLGAASVDTTVDAGVDLGAGTVNVGADAGAELGAGVAADVGADVGVDAGAGAIDAGIEADAAGADVGVDVGVDLSGSDAGIDVDIGLLGTEIDLGLGGGSQSDSAPDAADADDSGGLLGRILRRARL